MKPKSNQHPYANYFLSYCSSLNPSIIQNTSIAALDENLRRIYYLAQQTWPDIHLAAEIFLSYLARQLPPDTTDILQSLHLLENDDIYFVCACLEKIPEAIHAFETEVLKKMEIPLLNLLKSREMLDDLKGQLIQKFIYGNANSQPKIAGYRGKKKLRNWIYIAAMRQALTVLQKNKKEKPLTDLDYKQLSAMGDDPELQYLKVVCRKKFAAAFQTALSSLSFKDRNILRYHYIEGLSVDKIAKINNVHRVTVSKWLMAIRQQLLTQIQTILLADLNINQNTFQSMFQLIKSQFNVSICQYLKKSEDPSE